MYENNLRRNNKFGLLIVLIVLWMTIDINGTFSSGKFIMHKLALRKHIFFHYEFCFQRNPLSVPLISEQHAN